MKANTTNKRKLNMKNRNISYPKSVPAVLIALVFSCFSLSQTAKADNNNDRSIVGLWKVHYFEGSSEYFQSFDQWHSDGQEFEVAGFFGALCQGTWKQTGRGTVKLFHVGWNFDANGALIGYFEETQLNTLSQNGQTYRGTWDIKNFDTNGNFVSEDQGTLTATRLTVH